MELKHNETEYRTNVTLSWQILNSTCNTSRLMSRLQCDADNSDRAYSLSTTDTKAIIPSENLQAASGNPAYFNLTSLNYLLESDTVCPNVRDSLRFNGKILMVHYNNLYVLVISQARGMYAIYCTKVQGRSVSED
jgi:hypothetical protein